MGEIGQERADCALAGQAGVYSLQFLWVSADPTFSQILSMQIPLFYLFDNKDPVEENLYSTLIQCF